MSNEQTRRTSGGATSYPATIPRAPPLPAPQPLQRARDAAYRIIGYPTQQSRPVSPVTRALGNTARSASLGANDATTSHKTGLEINTVAINERGTHALVGGKEIFKTIKLQDGSCAEDLNLRTVIRSTPTSASGRPRQTYSIDIADVAWAKGESGDYVAAATSSGKIILYDLGHAGLQAAQLHEHYRQVHKVTFNPHRGNLLLSGSQDGTVRLWDIRDVRNQASTLQSKRKYSGRSDGVRDVKWSLTDGVDFAFGTDSGDIQRWDIRNLKAAKVKIPAHALACNSIDWHPDGKHIISASLDKTVRVWDFSTDRKQKPGWEIKTPYPVMNARWRPSCESSVPNDKAARQCTQLVTAYTRDHPVIHVWDFRRPALPFREIEPYSSAPTDLLWHSQDLLWSVGREGIFLQSDIQHTSKVIDRRNLQSFAVSSEGDVKFVVQKRRQQRERKVHEAPSLTTHTSNASSSSPENFYLSRSWADDSIDHSFLVLRPPSKRNQSRDAGKSSHSSTMQGAIIPFELSMSEQHSFRPIQFGADGRLPFLEDPSVFRYLARNYVATVELKAEITDAFIDEVAEAFKTNRLVADISIPDSTYREWRMIGEFTIKHLEERLQHKRRFGSDEAAYASNYASNKDGSKYGVSLLTQQLAPKYAAAQIAAARAEADAKPIPPTLSKFEPLHHLPDVYTIDIEEEKPFPLVGLLRRKVKSHIDQGDAQMASVLLTLIVPLLPLTHALPAVEAEMHIIHYSYTYGGMGYSPIEVEYLVNTYIRPVIAAGLRPLEIENILSTYHERLLTRHCQNEAIALRKLAYPAYPSVYEDYIKDNCTISLKCCECGKPVVSGMKTLHCESCGTKQVECPICGLKEAGAVKVSTRCLLCGHGGHSACLKEWFAHEEGGGACPTAGCLCECGKQ